MILAPLLALGALAADGVYALPGVDAGTPDADLRPFEGVIGGARLVGLGESRHCNGGYLGAKARLVRWLVERQGFRLVAIEVPWVRARAATDYVARGEGSARRALAALYTAFRDPETEALLAWLATWNVDHPDDRVSFVGFDVQDALELLLRELAARGVSADEVAACRAGDCPASADDPWIQLTLDTIAARRALDRANGGSRLPGGPRRLRYSRIRDAAMADTLLAIRALVAPDARTVVLAHDAHLARRFSGWGPLRFEDTGAHLAERLGDDWVAVGLYARALESCQGDAVRDGPRDAEQVVMEAAGAPAALVDLREADLLPGAWRLDGRRMVPADQWDALLVLDHARAAVDPLGEPREGDPARR